MTLLKTLQGNVLEPISDTSLSPPANYYGLRTADLVHPHMHKLSWYTACSKKPPDRLLLFIYLQPVKMLCRTERRIVKHKPVPSAVPLAVSKFHLQI